jgi:hypothetical protein
MRFVRFGLALVALSLVAAGCGGPARVGSNSSEQTADDQLVAWTKCMRDHGVVVDAESDGEGRFSISIGRPGEGGKSGGTTTGAQGGPDARTEAAMKACEDKMPQRGQDLTPEERAKLEDQLLAFAQCMRQHGIDMPDPQDGGFIQKRVDNGNGQNTFSNGPDPDSEEFKAAEKACEDKLPNKGQGGRALTREGGN